mgnify:FL=1
MARDSAIKIKAADWVMIVAALKDARDAHKRDKATVAQLTRIIDQIESAFSA